MEAITRKLDLTGVFGRSGPSRPKRTLAAIMFTDIVGYSAMMQRDERGALEARTRYRAALTKAVDCHDGAIVQHYGDGSLSIFRSAVQASRAAVGMQQCLHGDRGVPVRIGLHFSDVVRDGEGVYGNGVNVAARIQSLCPPGAVLVSDRMALEVRNQEGLSTRSMGTFQLKNIEDPVNVHALDDARIGPAVAERISSTAAVQLEPPSRPLRDAPPRLGPVASVLWELKRRKVDRVALGYAAVALSLLSALELVVPSLGLPNVLVEAAVIGLFAGFPAAVVLSWVYDLTPGWLTVTPPTQPRRRRMKSGT